jgi:hypothetical protein
VVKHGARFEKRQAPLNGSATSTPNRLANLRDVAAIASMKLWNLIRKCLCGMNETKKQESLSKRQTLKRIEPTDGKENTR